MISLIFSMFMILGEHNHSPPTEHFEISPKQRICLFRNIWHEGRGESLEGQLWIAQTTINRVGSTDFPDSICGVVRQKNAFSWYHEIPKNKHKVKPDNKLEQQAYNQIELAINIVKILNSLNIDIAKGSKFYYKVGARKPRYLKSATLVKVVGNHKFYKD